MKKTVFKTKKHRVYAYALILGMIIAELPGSFIPFSSVSTLPNPGIYPLASATDPYPDGYFDKSDELQNAKDTADASKNTAQDIADQIEEINKNIVETAELIETQKSEIKEIEADIAAIDQDISDKESKIGKEKDSLGKILAMMYEAGSSNNYIAVIMNAETPEDLMNRPEYITGVTDNINNRVDSYLNMISELELNKSELEELIQEKDDQNKTYQSYIMNMQVKIDDLIKLKEAAEKKAEDANEVATKLQQELSYLEAQERTTLMNTAYNGEMSNVTYTGDGSTYYSVSPYTHTDQQLRLLASLIQAEAGSRSYPGMIAVGSVVMNRVADPRFDNTIEGVIYAKNQFSPAGSGRLAVILAQGPVPACYQAAQDVLNGKRNVPNFYFKSAWYAEKHGIKGVNIGGNVFH